MALNNFKLKSSSNKPPVAKSSGGNSGYNALMGMMIAQQKSQNAQSGMGQDIQATRNQLGGTIPIGSTFSTGAQGPKVNLELNRPYNQTELQDLQHAESINNHINNLESFMKNDPGGFKSAFTKANVNIPGLSFGTKGNIMGFPTTYGDQKAQSVKFALTDMGDRLLRLRSGAQINEQEYQRLRGLLPTWEDISSDKDNSFKTIHLKLNTFKNEFNNTVGRIQQGRDFQPQIQSQSSQESSQTDDPLGLFK